MSLKVRVRVRIRARVRVRMRVASSHVHWVSIFPVSLQMRDERPHTNKKHQGADVRVRAIKD